MTLIVCGLSHLQGVITSRAPSHLVTLLDPELMIATPPGVEPSRHLRLAVDDINRPVDGYVLADEAMVAELIAFGRAWDQNAPMVVHCMAGISRSTASAFAIVCERNPNVSERAIATTLRRAAPHALPNRRIVALADDLLGRRGRMVDAIDAIGGNGLVPEGVPFDLPARY